MSALLSPPPCTPATADAFLSEANPSLQDAFADRPSPVLVLGAGGKMGLHLCVMLRNAGVSHVVAVSRFQSHRDRATFTAHGIHTVACDLADPASLRGLPDAETVFFLAGVKFGTAADPELLHRINVLVPRHVAQRFSSSRIVALSTGCVYPFVSVTSSGATEQTPPQPVGDYAASCRQREEEFSAAADRAGTPVVLIRLNYAVEFRYGVLVDIAAKVREGQPIDLTMGHVNLIWQRDAIESVIRARALAAAPARPLNLTGVGVLRVRELAEDFGRLFGVAPRFVGTEAETAWLNDASVAHRLWGAPPTALKTMETWVAQWLHAGYPTWGKPTGFERRDGQF